MYLLYESNMFPATLQGLSLEPMRGIEPLLPEYKTDVLPLSLHRLNLGAPIQN